MAKHKKASLFDSEIRSLINQGLTNPEISINLNLSQAQVASYVQEVIGGNPNYLKRKTKHKHLHEEILKLRLKMSDKEIREKLSLNKSEMKSCLSRAYNDPKLAHLRKDKRRRDSWSSKELRFLFRWSGIISQEEINKHLKRGKNRIVIKEKLQSLGLCSKNINGLTLNKFKSIFKREPVYVLETHAGSPASKFTDIARWKIIPWCHVEEMLNDGVIGQTEAFKTYVKSMALFQKWVHGEDYWSSLTSLPAFNLDKELCK
jgi:predicted transcriptional regulator